MDFIECFPSAKYGFILSVLILGYMTVFFSPATLEVLGWTILLFGYGLLVLTLSLHIQPHFFEKSVAECYYGIAALLSMGIHLVAIFIFIITFAMMDSTFIEAIDQVIDNGLTEEKQRLQSFKIMTLAICIGSLLCYYGYHHNYFDWLPEWVLVHTDMNINPSIAFLYIPILIFFISSWSYMGLMNTSYRETYDGFFQQFLSDETLSNNQYQAHKATAVFLILALIFALTRDLGLRLYHYHLAYETLDKILDWTAYGLSICGMICAFAVFIYFVQSPLKHINNWTMIFLGFYISVLIATFGLIFGQEHFPVLVTNFTLYFLPFVLFWLSISSCFEASAFNQKIYGDIQRN